VVAAVSAALWWLASSPASDKLHSPAAGDGLPPQMEANARVLAFVVAGVITAASTEDDQRLFNRARSVRTKAKGAFVSESALPVWMAISRILSQHFASKVLGMIIYLPTPVFLARPDQLNWCQKNWGWTGPAVAGPRATFTRG
jgi:hypothetical protein